MTRFLWIAALLTTLALAVLSCGQKGRTLKQFKDKDGFIEIEFWHAVSAAQAKAVNELVDAFNKEQAALPATQTRYKVKAVYQGAYASLQQKLIAGVYAGRPPGLAMMYESWATRFLSNGCLQPVDHFAETDKEWKEKELPDYFESFIKSNTFKITKNEDGRSWRVHPGGTPTLCTLPFNKSVYVLCVNQDLMKSVGYDEPPKTWDELKDLAVKMTIKRDDGQFDRYGFATRALIEAYTPLLMATGVNYMDENGDFTFQGPEGEKAMQYLADLVLGENRAGYVEADYLNSVFGQGKIGMYISSTASFPFNDSSVGNKFIWRAYPVPSPDGKPAPHLSQGTNVGIFSRGYAEGTELPEEVQQGSWLFLKYITNVENNVKWAIATGYMPIRKSAVEHPDLKAYMEKNVNFANSVGVIPYAMFEPRPLWWDNIRTVFGREVEAVLFGRKSADDGLKSALERAEFFKATAG